MNSLGEVFKPEDIINGKKPSDLSHWPGRITPTSLQEVIREISALKSEIKKIKQVLNANGIQID